jgi:HAD superfamily hydrolase (TIGR01549 family)
MFSAVLFDLDDTLISDELVAREAAYVTALELTRDETKAMALARAVEIEARMQWSQLPAAALAYVLRIGHGPTEGLWATYDPKIPEEATLAHETARIRPEVWARALTATGLTGDPVRLEKRWQASRAQFPLYPDTNEVLARLRPLTKLGVVTNGVSGLQRRKYDSSGLAHWFDAVVISGELGIGKPERGIFDFIAHQLGVNVTDCLMVGDNPERDIQGGINAGMKTCWVDRGLRKTTTVPADVTVKSFVELWAWLEQQR